MHSFESPPSRIFRPAPSTSSTRFIGIRRQSAGLTAILEPLITGTRHTTISENAKSLYDNIWFDAAYVTEYTGQNGVDDFDVTVFDNDDWAASLAVSDHRPIWATFETGWMDDD